jgi:hypothetical protein
MRDSGGRRGWEVGGYSTSTRLFERMDYFHVYKSKGGYGEKKYEDSAFFSYFISRC